MHATRRAYNKHCVYLRTLRTIGGVGVSEEDPGETRDGGHTFGSWSQNTARRFGREQQGPMAGFYPYEEHRGSQRESVSSTLGDV